MVGENRTIPGKPHGHPQVAVIYLSPGTDLTIASYRDLPQVKVYKLKDLLHRIKSRAATKM